MSIALTSSIGIYTTSETTQTCGTGNYVFTLDNITGFVVGGIVQIWSNTDNSNQMFGTVTQVSANNITVAVFTSQGTITDSSWTVNQIGVHPQSGTNPSSALTVDNTTDLSFAGLGTFPTLGTTINFQAEPGKAFSNYSSVYVQCMADYTSWFIGTVLSYDPIGGGINIFVTLVGSGQTTAGPWAIALMSSTAVDADLTAYASDTLTPTTGSQITFTTVQAGKYFPIQGVVLIDDLTSTQNVSGTDNHYTGTVVAYSGNTLIINITSAFGTGTQSSSWGIYLVSGPAVSNIDLYQMNGLRIYNSGGNVTVNPGSILDSTGTMILTLSSIATITSPSVVSVVGAGTVSLSGTTVSGTGTSFTSFFSTAATLTDLNNQLTELGLATLTFPSVITSNGRTAATTTITDDLDMVVNGSLFNNASTSYTRGGVAAEAASVAYGVMLAYNSTTGSVGAFMTSFTPSGSPDLPTGYTNYRIIGYVVLGSGGSFVAIGQPLITNVMTTAGDMLYFGDATDFGGTTFQTYNQRLPIGSSGQILTATNGLPIWASYSTLNKGATVQVSGFSPTSNSTSTFKMMGFGTQGATVTPNSTGNLTFTFDGTETGGASTPKTAQVYFGTGSAPSSGAATTGTAIGSQVTWGTPVVNSQIPFSMTRASSGFAVSTAIWFDLAIAAVSSGAVTASITGVNFSAKES